MFRLFFFFSCLVLNVKGIDQSVSVRGRLICSEPVRVVSIPVSLYDMDWPDPDDLMGTTTTDMNGGFLVSGYTDSFSEIKPELRIYSSCRTGKNECFGLKFNSVNKEKCITKGSQTPARTCDFGIIDMDSNPMLDTCG